MDQNKRPLDVGFINFSRISEIYENKTFQKFKCFFIHDPILGGHILDHSDFWSDSMEGAFILISLNSQ